MVPRDQEKTAFTTPLSLYEFECMDFVALAVGMCLEHYSVLVVKCAVFQQLWHHVVDQEGIGPDPEKVTAVLDWPAPTTIRLVRALLGIAGYYWRFDPGFAAIARLLNMLLTGIPVDKKSETSEFISLVPSIFWTFKG